MNLELNKTKLDLATRVRTANEWAAKYSTLRKQLQEVDSDATLSRQALIALQSGNLIRAEAILDKILAREEESVDRTAANQYRRGLISDLQFQLSSALPHYEKAYQYRPLNRLYASAYAQALFFEGDFAQAEPIFKKLLESVKALPANKVPFETAVIQNHLAEIYVSTERWWLADQAYDAVLKSYRGLAKGNPLRFEPHLALSLNNAGVFYENQRRADSAEVAYNEALGLSRQLAEHLSPYYLWFVCQVLTNLGKLYREENRLDDSRKAYLESINIAQKEIAARSYQEVFLPVLGLTLNNIGNLYLQIGKYPEAQEAARASLRLYRELALKDEVRYSPGVILASKSLGFLLKTEGKLPEATEYYKEALVLQRKRVFDGNSSGNLRMATTLDQLADVYEQMSKHEDVSCLRAEASHLRAGITTAMCTASE